MGLMNKKGETDWAATRRWLENCLSRATLEASKAIISKALEEHMLKQPPEA